MLKHRISWCVVTPKLAIPAFIQLFLLMGWMLWVITIAYRADNVSVDEAFKVPVHRLLRGMYGGYESDVDLMDNSGVHPFRDGHAKATRGMQGVPLIQARDRASLQGGKVDPLLALEGYSEVALAPPAYTSVA